MFFIREAFVQKPFEKKSLVYVRGMTALLLTAVCFAYFVYLAIQVYEDQPLIKLLAVNLTDSYPSPDIEMCSANSPLRLWYCDIVKMDWSIERRNNCTGLVKKGVYSPTMFCQIYQSNGSISFGLDSFQKQDSQVRRIDFYWEIDNLTASVSQTIAIPALSLQLYDPKFNPWYTGDTATWIPRQFQAYRDITMGVAKATTMQRYTTDIYFTPQIYKAIRPYDFGSLLGMIAQYVDIPTVDTNWLAWPMHFNSNFSNTAMTGQFSIQLASGTMKIQQEQRQHSILSLLALGGGAFGLVNILYVMLFGMNRLTPWGLVHRIPFFFEAKPIPTYERSDVIELVKTTTSSIRSSGFHNIDLEKAPLTADYHRWATEKVQDEHPLPEAPSIEPSSVTADDKSFHASERPLDLEARVQELERILADYFLDTKHLDRMRRKSYRHSMT